MFYSRLVPSTKIFIQFFVIQEPVNEDGDDIVCAYPEKYDDSLAAKIPSFVFPCSHRSEFIEEYSFIFTNEEAQLQFVICRYLPPPHGICLCFYSSQPWFEILHSLLTTVASEGLHKPENKEHLLAYLSHVDLLPLPQPGSCLYLPHPRGSESRKYVVPSEISPQLYTKYLYEFYNALDQEVWVDIFTSVLFERRIIFHSERLQALSACVLSTISLIYPLDWVHLIYPILSKTASTVAACPAPFIAGVHSCLIEDIVPELSDDTRVVDLDKQRSFVTGPSTHGSDVLPKSLRKLLRSLLSKCNLASSSRSVSSGSGLVFGLDTVIKSMQNAFLQAMVGILGGYHNALVSDGPGKVRVDKELFVASRGSGMKPFLEQLYTSQMVQDFLIHRVNCRNEGTPVQDLFEEACINFDPKMIRTTSNNSATNDLLCAVRKGTKKMSTHGLEKFANFTSKVRDLRRKPDSEKHPDSLQDEYTTSGDSPDTEDGGFLSHSPSHHRRVLQNSNPTTPTSAAQTRELEFSPLPDDLWQLSTDPQLARLFTSSYGTSDGPSVSPSGSVRSTLPRTRAPIVDATDGYEQQHFFSEPPPTPLTSPPISPLSPSTKTPTNGGAASGYHSINPQLPGGSYNSSFSSPQNSHHNRRQIPLPPLPDMPQPPRRTQSNLPPSCSTNHNLSQSATSVTKKPSPEVIQSLLDKWRSYDVEALTKAQQEKERSTSATLPTKFSMTDQDRRLYSGPDKSIPVVPSHYRSASSRAQNNNSRSFAVCQYRTPPPLPPHMNQRNGDIIHSNNIPPFRRVNVANHNSYRTAPFHPSRVQNGGNIYTMESPPPQRIKLVYMHHQSDVTRPPSSDVQTRSGAYRKLGDDFFN